MTDTHNADLQDEPAEAASHSADVEARRRWMGVLARAGRDDLEQLWNGLVNKPSYTVLRAPEVGMVMVRGRAGGTGAPFCLGEMTLTRCAVETADGRLGVSYLAGRDPRRAELAAVLDALLQDPSRRPSLMGSIVEPLMAARQKARRMRRAETAATKVEFFTMVRGD